MTKICDRWSISMSFWGHKVTKGNVNENMKDKEYTIVLHIKLSVFIPLPLKNPPRFK